MADTDVDQDGGELAAWRELLQSEGWRLFRAHLSREWGPEGYARRVRAALADVQPGPERAYEIGLLTSQIEDTAKAVDELAAYPLARAKALEDKAQRAAASASATGVRGLVHRVAQRGR